MALSYNVYRNGEKIAEGLTEPTYIDNTAAAQESYSYTVTGETDFIESSPSNEANADWTSLSEEMVGNQHIVVYPNPTNGVLTIETQYAASMTTECAVFNIMGQEVMRQVGTGSQMNLNLSALPEGTYFVKVVSESESKTVKVVKIQ